MNLRIDTPEVLSKKEADIFLQDVFPADFNNHASLNPYDVLNALEDYLSNCTEELHKLENRIKNQHIDNLNHFNINKAISLHFIVEAGKNYLQHLEVLADLHEDEYAQRLNENLFADVIHDRNDFSDDDLYIK